MNTEGGNVTTILENNINHTNDTNNNDDDDNEDNANFLNNTFDDYNVVVNNNDNSNDNDDVLEEAVAAMELEDKCTINCIQDNIIATNTSKQYTCEITKFLCWLLNNQNNCLTQHGTDVLIVIFNTIPGESKCLYRSRIVASV
jgi:hypothetical protein